ncbi:MAG: hypothetical protein Q7S43_03970 [bacterium]|nr:hypothetical protein [bacterium]
MAEVNSTQKLDATVERKEVLIDGGWNLFKTVMVFLGGAAVLAWLIWIGYHWGSSGCYTCTQNKPPVAAVAIPPASLTQAETTAVIAELAKDLSAITNMMADQKAAVAQTSASATASAATTVVAPPPPKTERRVPATKQAEPACPCPPGTVKKPAVDQGPSPAPTLSFAERRRNEMWSALQR